MVVVKSKYYFQSLFKFQIIISILFESILSLEESKNSISVKRIINYLKISGKENKIYNGQKLRKLNYFENSKNMLNLKKIVNLFLKEFDIVSNKYEHYSHNKIKKRQFKPSNKKEEEKYYKIDFKKSYCSISNNTSSPFVNIG